MEHFIGHDCLQTRETSWEGDKPGLPTCPKSPTTLSIISTDCLCVRNPQSANIAYLRSDPKLDQQVDEVPLASCEEDIDGCLDVSLGDMVAKMHERSTQSASRMKKLLVVVEKLERDMLAQVAQALQLTNP
jgi:hypothetical protein